MLRGFQSALLACFAFVALDADFAAAGVPSAANSTVSPCFVACPAGDASYVVVVRDIANNPIAGSTVRLQFIDCETFPVCDECCDGIVIDRTAHSVSAATDASGIASFALRMGGVSPVGAGMNVYADGVLLGPVRTVSSPDLTGNLVVEWDDITELSALFESGYELLDLNCSGGFGLDDFYVLQYGHLGHDCDAPTPARRPSWGAVKALYR
jgi:hypothetical protein